MFLHPSARVINSGNAVPLQISTQHWNSAGQRFDKRDVHQRGSGEVSATAYMSASASWVSRTYDYFSNVAEHVSRWWWWSEERLSNKVVSTGEFRVVRRRPSVRPCPTSSHQPFAQRRRLSDKIFRVGEFRLFRNRLSARPRPVSSHPSLPCWTIQGAAGDRVQVQQRCRGRLSLLQGVEEGAMMVVLQGGPADAARGCP